MSSEARRSEEPAEHDGGNDPDLQHGSSEPIDRSRFEHQINKDEAPTKSTGLSDTSPDISLSSQHTLRYVDVEPQTTEHNISHESSDSIETLDEPVRDYSEGPGLSLEDQSFLQNLSLAPDIPAMARADHSASSVSADALSINSEEGGSGDSHEVIPEFSSMNISRPESLSLSRSNSKRHESESDEHQNRDASKDGSGKASVSNSGKTEASCGREYQNTSKSSVVPLSHAELGSKSKPEVKDNVHNTGTEEQVSESESLPQGTITRKGDMIQFVASDLQAKIKQSSPLSQTATPSSSSRRSSIRSIRSFASASSSTSVATSSGLSQSPGSSHYQQSPEDIPPIDVAAVVELENHATRVADSLDLMMGNIRNNLHKMSAITIGCQDAYKRSVDITCDSVDGSIKSMYALMAKCEELNSSMVPVKQLANQIKEIKRILDLFESQLAEK